MIQVIGLNGTMHHVSPMSLTLGNPFAFMRNLSTTPSSHSWTAVSVDVRYVGFEYCGSFWMEIA